MKAMNRKKTYLIGLAGQSCAGKNVVADVLKEKGFYVIDADVVAHMVLDALQTEVLQRFLPHAEARDIRLQSSAGILDRSGLASLLFAAPALLAEHEAFILPHIERHIRTLIRDAHTEQPDRPIVLNAPTLHKTSLTAECSFIFYITAPFLIRLIRGKKRDKRPLRQLIARFMQQKDFYPQYLTQNADIVNVKNAHTVHALRKKIERVLRKKGF